MLKVYVVVTVFNQVVATIGPVPYDMKECHARIVQLKNDLAADFNSAEKTKSRNESTATLAGHKMSEIKLQDIVHHCVQSPVRPEGKGEYQRFDGEISE